MDIRKLTNSFYVSPQLMEHDMAELAKQGFKTVVCNRPDEEVPAQLSRASIKKAVESAGMIWTENVIISGGMTMENVQEQGRLNDEAQGPVIAYCRSGTRSATAWALSQAGQRPVDEILQIGADAGYDLSSIRLQLDILGKS